MSFLEFEFYIWIGHMGLGSGLVGSEWISVLYCLFCVFLDFFLFLNFGLDIYGIGIRAVGESLYFVPFLDFDYIYKIGIELAGRERIFYFVFLFLYFRH